LGVRFASVRRFSKSAIRNPNRSEKIPPNPPKIEVFLSIDLEPIWRPGIARSLFIHFRHGGRLNTTTKNAASITLQLPVIPAPTSITTASTPRPLLPFAPILLHYALNTSAVCPQLRQQSAPPSLQRLPSMLHHQGLYHRSVIARDCVAVVDLATRTLQKVYRVAEVGAPLPIHKWGFERIAAISLMPAPNT
jgi:hypothetical protein